MTETRLGLREPGLATRFIWKGGRGLSAAQGSDADGGGGAGQGQAESDNCDGRQGVQQAVHMDGHGKFLGFGFRRRGVPRALSDVDDA